EVRRALLESAVEIPDHGIGVEGGAVVEAYATTQLERPFLAVAGILLPALGEARHDVGGGICFAQVPVDEGVEGGQAHEAPSKPLLGTPVVVGTSVAVMAMRRVPWATAGPDAATVPSHATVVSPARRHAVQSCPLMILPPWPPSVSGDCAICSRPDRRRLPQFKALNRSTKLPERRHRAR